MAGRNNERHCVKRLCHDGPACISVTQELKLLRRTKACDWKFKLRAFGTSYIDIGTVVKVPSYLPRKYIKD